MSTVLSRLPRARVEYPSTDGKPVAESDFQRDSLLYAVDVLQQHFRARPDVYVSGNLLLYYEEGNPKAVVAPDVFVVMGASNHRRMSYLLWQEPKGPDFVLEVTSRSTRKRDQGPKRELYRRLGVQEYWQYDPTGDYLDPALQGYELRGGEYEALPAVERGADRLLLRSAVLGLELRLEAGEFRFRDAAADAPAAGQVAVGEGPVVVDQEVGDDRQLDGDGMRPGSGAGRAAAAGGTSPG